MCRKVQTKFESTMGELSLSTKAESTTSSTDKKNKKAVRFETDENLCTIVGYVASLDEITKPERSELWWTGRDFKSFKSSATKASTYLLDNSYEDGCIVDIGYQKAQYIALQNDDEDVYKILQDESRPEMQYFRLWTINNRGLEHWVAKIHCGIRQDVIGNAKTTVFNIQRTESTQEIAEEYANAARASRIMARWYGYADQLVVDRNICYDAKSTSKRHSNNDDDIEYAKNIYRTKLQEEFHSGGSLTMKPVPCCHHSSNYTVLTEFFSDSEKKCSSSKSSNSSSNKHDQRRSNRKTKIMGIIPKFR